MTGNPVLHNADWQPFIEGSRMTINGIELVLVPAGCFTLGNDPLALMVREEGVPDGGHHCFDKPFYTSRTEITREQFGQLGCVAGRGDSSNPQQPRINVTWVEARDCAARAGMRLPTEPEWEYAARGPDGLAYPWGNDWNPDNVVWEGNANRTTSDVGSRPAGASWVGALDMAGNVAEWTSTMYRVYPYRVANREDNTNLSRQRTLRGGSRLDSEAALRSASRFNSPTDYYYNFVGFRLVFDFGVG
jgi:formylglycine-generating enzyme required for sulfatase activity